MCCRPSRSGRSNRTATSFIPAGERQLLPTRSKIGIEAARRDDGADLIAARAVSVEERLNVTLRALAIFLGLELRRKIGALLARQRDHVPSERQLHVFEAGETAIEIATSIGQAVGQHGRIDRRLGRAGADMRPSNERGIADKRHAAEY